MERKLLQNIGVLAIPLKRNEENPLNPQPNFLILEGMFSPQIATLPVLGEVMSINTTYKIVFRELLPASEELQRVEEIRDFVYEHANQFIPIDAVVALSSYEKLQEHKEYINQLLSLFQFRGALTGFVLKIDEAVLTEILTNI